MDKQTDTVTFKVVAEELLQKMAREGRAEATLTKTRWLLEFAYPSLGPRPIAKITPLEILDVLRKIEARGHTRQQGGCAALAAWFPLRDRDRSRRSRSNLGSPWCFDVTTGQASRHDHRARRHWCAASRHRWVRRTDSHTARFALGVVACSLG
jgi:hypothetical protein